MRTVEVCAMRVPSGRGWQMGADPGMARGWFQGELSAMWQRRGAPGQETLAGTNLSCSVPFV